MKKSAIVALSGGAAALLIGGLLIARQPGGFLDTRNDVQKRNDLVAEIKRRGLCGNRVMPETMNAWRAAGKQRPQPGHYYVPCGYQGLFGGTPPPGKQCFHSDIAKGRLIEWPCPGR